jgi:NAD(P)-dependent dehydrogenase (short-subunit alcohol dehydrogenase family)
LDLTELRFEGQRALVVGGATGMGAAAAGLLREMGAAVTVMDFARMADAAYVRVDLRDPTSIAEALDQCEGGFGVLLSCAGVAEGPDVDKVNFIGQRHLIDCMLRQGLFASEAAIGMISSLAGLGWEFEYSRLGEFLATPDFESAVSWIEAHPEQSGYRWSKLAVSSYVARQSYPLRRRGIRINAILPGPTDTPLARANADTWLAHARDFRESIGIGPATAAEQALPLLFLCSSWASHINGVNLVVDAGYTSSGMTDTYPAPMVRDRMRVS